jgi:hypothetical protein
MVKHRKTDPEEGALLLHPAFLKLQDGHELQRPRHSCCHSWLTMVAMCAVVAVVCAIDRSAMSVAIIPMASGPSSSCAAKPALAPSPGPCMHACRPGRPPVGSPPATSCWLLLAPPPTRQLTPHRATPQGKQYAWGDAVKGAVNRRGPQAAALSTHACPRRRFCAQTDPVPLSHPRSAFNVGYMLTNFFGGTLAAAHSPKKVRGLLSSLAAQRGAAAPDARPREGGPARAAAARCGRQAARAPACWSAAGRAAGC